MVRKPKQISLLDQQSALMANYPNSSCKRNRESSLEWIGTLQPLPLSRTFLVRIFLKKGKHPEVFVLDPAPLPLAHGKSRLPHVYSTKNQQLCLYYPKYNEWNSKMYLAKTIVPWISEWLCFYEIWVGTGEWHGGGIHDEDLLKN